MTQSCGKCFLPTYLTVQSLWKKEGSGVCSWFSSALQISEHLGFSSLKQSALDLLAVFLAVTTHS
jgi:hypothetical protein